MQEWKICIWYGEHMVYSINFWVKVNQLPNYKCFNNWLLTSVLKTSCDLKSVKQIGYL